ncbi:MAG TPA: arylsulfotransferase family protein, partial [Solirubrobacteraceae bacterium]|nr:arylsulfotransferase family protein [Solirubrobacteraceae bacterium]
MVTAVALAAAVALDPHPLRARSEQAAAGEAVMTYPGPGWRFASPRTTITIRGTGAASLAGLRVTGSASGEHAGRLHALRLGSGAVFRPDAPFGAGERVTVRLPDAAGDDARAFSFAIARPARYAASDDDPGNPAKRAPPTRARRARQGCPLRSQRYVTRPGLRPTAFCLRRTAGSTPPAGHLLLTPRPGARERLGEQHSAMLVSDAGRVLGFSRRPAKTHDLKVVEIGGRPLLALFQQTAKGGAYVLLDRRYREVRRIGAGNGYPVNSHELQVTPRETAYVSAYARVRVGASGRLVTDFVVQELDLVTGDVLFEWHALDHVSTAASFASRPAGGRSWDYFHGNAIEPPVPGTRTLLVSARNTSAVYGIDSVTGSVRWILGGKADQFGLAARHPAWRFCAQHDARWMPNGDIMVFDNGGKALTEGAPLCPVHPARVERFAVDVDRK